MAVTRAQKEAILKKLTEEFSKAKSVVFADYKGLTVAQATQLRRDLRAAKVDYMVAKKTLIQKAAESQGVKNIPQEMLAGAVGVAFGMEDQIAPARVMHAFGKKNSNLPLLGAYMDGTYYDKVAVKALAILPSREELLAKLMGSLKAPIQGMVSVLNGPLRGFLQVLNGLKDKKPMAPAA